MAKTSKGDSQVSAPQSAPKSSSGTKIVNVVVVDGRIVADQTAPQLGVIQ